MNATGSTSQFVHPTLDIFGSKLKNTVGPEFNLFTPTANAARKLHVRMLSIQNAIGPIGPYRTEECGLVRDCWKAVDERGGQNSLSEVD